MKKALLYFGCLAVVFGVLIGMTFSKKAADEVPEKIVDIYDVAVQMFEKETGVKIEDVKWDQIYYLPKEYHTVEQAVFDRENLVYINDIENFPGKLAELLEGVSIYDKAEEPDFWLGDEIGKIAMSGLYRDESEKNNGMIYTRGATIKISGTADKVKIDVGIGDLGSAKTSFTLKK